MCNLFSIDGLVCKKKAICGLKIFGKYFEQVHGTIESRQEVKNFTSNEQRHCLLIFMLFGTRVTKLFLKKTIF